MRGFRAHKLRWHTRISAAKMLITSTFPAAEPPLSGMSNLSALLFLFFYLLRNSQRALTLAAGAGRACSSCCASCRLFFCRCAKEPDKNKRGIHKLETFPEVCQYVLAKSFIPVGSSLGVVTSAGLGDISRGSVATCGLAQGPGGATCCGTWGLVTFSVTTLDSFWDTCWGVELMLPLPTPALTVSRKRILYI